VRMQNEKLKDEFKLYAYGCNINFPKVTNAVYFVKRKDRQEDSDAKNLCAIIRNLIRKDL
jgi:hypothetical protein